MAQGRVQRTQKRVAVLHLAGQASLVLSQELARVQHLLLHALSIVLAGNGEDGLVCEQIVGQLWSEKERDRVSVALKRCWRRWWQRVLSFLFWYLDLTDR
jgi:hypothetical protein